MIFSTDHQFQWVGVQTVKFDDFQCRPSISMIFSADHEFWCFGVQTIQFDDFQCRPSISTTFIADHKFRWFGMQTVKFYDFGCRRSTCYVSHPRFTWHVFVTQYRWTSPSCYLKHLKLRPFVSKAYRWRRLPQMTTRSLTCGLKHIK